MSNFIIGTEVKIFCLLAVVILYLFHKNCFQFQHDGDKYLYHFSFTGIIFSIFGSVMSTALFRNVCFAICGIECFMAVCSVSEYALSIKESKITALKKVGYITAGFIFGILSFYSLKSGMNAPLLVLVAFNAAVLVVEQNNKIRVDNLTKLYNRYGMDAELKEQLRQYERDHNDSFYIIACDLDNFKHINDSWGHPEGDRALILIAEALTRVAKKFDSDVFRIGGDEFVIITDKSEEGLALEVTVAIKDELDNIDFRSDFDIKMSIGVALYDGVTPIDELLSNADKKLYEAKKNKK